MPEPVQSRMRERVVAAHVRHEHTGYDRLLMQGSERLVARRLVGEKMDAVLAKWRGG
jgi:hypothetical protein